MFKFLFYGEGFKVEVKGLEEYRIYGLGLRV
jgi:hypothetical protein